MEELRSEIRAAFDREQAAHPPSPALRPDVVNAVATHRRPAPNLPWVAVAAALILGLLVVVGFMSTRLIHVPAPARKPPASLPVMGTPVGATMIPLTFGHGAENFGAFNATGQSLFQEFACRSDKGSTIHLTLTKAKSGEFVASESVPCVDPGFHLDELSGVKGQLVLTIDAPDETEWEVYVASGPGTPHP
jgi:hypothetical protein